MAARKIASIAPTTMISFRSRTPEYCSPPASAWHRHRIDAVLTHARHVIVNSGTTAAELRILRQRWNDAAGNLNCAAGAGLPAFFGTQQQARVRSPLLHMRGHAGAPKKHHLSSRALATPCRADGGSNTASGAGGPKRLGENESIIDRLERAPLRSAGSYMKSAACTTSRWRC